MSEKRLQGVKSLCELDIVALFEHGKGSVVFRPDSGCALALENKTDLTEVISVDQVRHRLRFFRVIGNGFQVLNFDMN